MNRCGNRNNSNDGNTSSNNSILVVTFVDLLKRNIPFFPHTRNQSLVMRVPYIQSILHQTQYYEILKIQISSTT